MVVKGLTAGAPEKKRATLLQERREPRRTMLGPTPFASVTSSEARRTFRAVTEDVALAFLDTIADPRAPWADRFTVWAAAKDLSPERARGVRLAVLRIRTFGLRRERP